MSGIENPPAFPCAEDHQVADALPWTQGMTLRDWFAGQALAGMQASHAGLDFKRDAERAYGFADAMLEVRKTGDAS